MMNIIFMFLCLLMWFSCLLMWYFISKKDIYKTIGLAITYLVFSIATILLLIIDLQK
jgi:membrane protein YdbS with pleckstrin-like domain